MPRSALHGAECRRRRTGRRLLVGHHLHAGHGLHIRGLHLLGTANHKRGALVVVAGSSWLVSSVVWTGLTRIHCRRSFITVQHHHHQRRGWSATKGAVYQSAQRPLADLV
jgi:hypothetical protein